MKKVIFSLAAAMILMGGIGAGAQTVKTDKKKTTQTIKEKKEKEVCDGNCRDCDGDKIGCKFEKKDVKKTEAEAKKAVKKSEAQAKKAVKKSEAEAKKKARNL